MASSSKQRSSPLSLISVRLLLVSCSPLLSPAFLVPTTPPHHQQHQQQKRQQQQQQRSRLVGQATSSLFAPPAATTASTAYPGVALTHRHCHGAGTSTTGSDFDSCSSSRGNGDGMTMCGWHAATTAARRATPTTTATCGRRQRVLPILFHAPSSSSNSRSSLLVLRASGGGRMGGDSSRRRTDRPDEYSGGERKKRKGRGSGGGGGFGGERGGGRGRGAEGVRQGESALPKDQEGELWGGESRLSNLEDKVEAEFSRKIDCSELSRKPKFYTIEATERESKALASRFSVEVITGLKADLRVLRAANSRKINIKGRVMGDVRQFCAKTLEPFDVSIAREFDTIVQEVSLDSVESTLWALEEDTETDEEIMEGDPLDLGEVTAQALALCIDPYATHPSVPREGGDGGDEGGVYKAYSGFGQPPEGEDEVMDVEAMRAFFDADD